MSEQHNKSNIGLNIGLGVASLFIPLIMLILGIVLMNNERKDLKKAGKVSTIVSSVCIALNLLIIIAFSIG